jgi:hypothetical protein
VALDVLDLAPPPSLPEAGAQCLGAVSAETAGEAGAALATRIADRRLLVLPPIDATSPVQATLSYDGITGSTVLERRGAPTDSQRPVQRAEPSGQLGVGTLVLAFLIGLVGLAVLALALTARSQRGARVRAAAGEVVQARLAQIRERKVPDEQRHVPRAEARRRRLDAWQDLNAELGGAPTARDLAEHAAWEEQFARLAAARHEAVLRERDEAKNRAVERKERHQRRAELEFAEERALRDSMALRGTPLPEASGPLADAERAQLAAVVEANRTLAGVRAAAEEATARRLAAEQAAEEAAALAGQEEAAAAAAQRERQAAEQAAAAAEQTATYERQLAGEASAARLAAEDEARAAERRAAQERAAAEQALARRLEAEAQAAAAESARALAAERELVAREAAEAAESARQAAAERLEEQRLALEAEQAARLLVQEEAAREQATRDVLQQQAAHEQAAREAAAREQVAREAALEQAARETAAREAALEAAAWQTAAREAALEQAARETVAREAALEESARETAAREAGLVESARETAARESAVEQAAREQTAREAVLEQAAREQAAREAVLEQAAREQAAREAALEQAAQEHTAREAALERAALEQAAREAALNQTAQEQALEQAAREAAIEQAAREAAIEQAASEQVAHQVPAAAPDLEVLPVAQRTVSSGSQVAAAADVRSRRLHVVAPAAADPDDESETGATEAPSVEPAAAVAPEVVSPDDAVPDDAVPDDAVADEPAPDEPAPEVPAPEVPAPEVATTAARVLDWNWDWSDERPRPSQVARHTRPARSLPVVPIIRVLAALLVPAVAVARTLLAGSWWTGAGAVQLVLLGIAGVLTLLGVRWVWAATSQPYALLRGTVRRIHDEQARLAEQAVAAVDLLAALREGGADEPTWAEFETRTGLVVPSSMRSAIDPSMDPTALVRYLAGRKQQLEAPQSLFLVTLVPVLTCLVPAALIVLSI